MSIDYKCLKYSIYLSHILCYWWRYCNVS